MPPSQLKRLKSSLREQGIVGPQKSKKQRRQAAKNGSENDSRVQRSAALQGIREHFNPFEIRASTRGSKHDFTNGRVLHGRVTKGSIARPGITKGLGEESRRRTLLVELQRRKKVGGIIDRRFGENNPKMTPEEKALERFVREKQREGKKRSLFDLEDGEEGDQLTHLGQSLSSDQLRKSDDFDAPDLGGSVTEDSDFEGPTRSAKRRKTFQGEEEQETTSNTDESQLDPERRKTQKEIMNEVIAKSKLHRYERQQAKDDDDELRAELDKGLPELLSIMHQIPTPQPQSLAQEAPNGTMNPDRAALLGGKDRSQADKEYDERLRQMALDQRSKPTERTMTEDEKLEHETKRLHQLEEERLRRMRGDQDSEAEASEEGEQDRDPTREQSSEDPFGLGSGLATRKQSGELEVEDEDEFIIEDDLVTSGSEMDADEAPLDNKSNGDVSDEEDQEFVQGLLSKEDAGRKDLTGRDSNHGESDRSVAYIYECPQNHAELLRITQNVPLSDLPVVVQRIRALYHPKLDPANKEKLAVFSAILVKHVSFLANHVQEVAFSTLEALIRHIHSLAKMFPEEIGEAFRDHLKLLHQTRATSPKPGDLVILTAIGCIFSTSDHFHQVVTPAMLYMSYYLSQKIPQTLSDLATGTYLSTLCLHYQRFSKRYIPEVVNHSLNCLYSLLAPPDKVLTGSFIRHSFPTSFRLQANPETKSRQLKFWDIAHQEATSHQSNEELKMSLIDAQLLLCGNMAELWAGNSAFYEIFEPVAACLSHMISKTCISRLGKPTKDAAQKTLRQMQILLEQARAARKPLLLHNHRPLPIKTFIPKFEESYNPDKHYDPDRDRASFNKLKAEHKKERKGAMRELRKDANFIAREALKEKKEKDAQYEKKYKRLLAEIQGEEGREANVYEREKRMRKKKR